MCLPEYNDGVWSVAVLLQVHALHPGGLGLQPGAEVGPGRVVYPSVVLCRTSQPQCCSPANITALIREQASLILAYPGQYSADQIKGKIVTTCFLEFFPTFVF